MTNIGYAGLTGSALRLQKEEKSLHIGDEIISCRYGGLHKL